MSFGIRFLLTWACNVAALWVAAKLVDGIDYESFWHLVLAGLVFGIVNWLVKPLVTLLALPVIVLTLGIALFFVNLLMLYVTAWLAPGFEIDGFWDAVLGTLVLREGFGPRRIAAAVLVTVGIVLLAVLR